MAPNPKFTTPTGDDLVSYESGVAFQERDQCGFAAKACTGEDHRNLIGINPQ